MTMHIECQHFAVYSKQYGLLCTILKYMLVITEMCYFYTMVFDDFGESLSPSPKCLEAGHFDYTNIRFDTYAVYVYFS